ncbi:MAG: hypothetical protein ABW166_01030 [Sedimenticola sp.]
MTSVSARYLLTLLLLPFSVYSSPDANCQRDFQPAKVHLEMLEGEVLLHTDKSVSQLIKKSRERNLEAGFKRLSGLTLMSFESRFNGKVMAYSEGSGFCADARSVDVEIGFKEFNVYILNRYRPGSCQYRVTKKHEMKHVALYRKVLAEALPELEAAINEAVSSQLPIWAQDITDAREAVSALIKNTVNPLMKRVGEEMKVANAAIDTRTRYRWEQAKCRSW